MKHLKILEKASLKETFNTEGTVKFKLRGELSDVEASDVKVVFKNLLMSQNKVVVDCSHVYNDESFTAFEFKYRKVTIETLFKALCQMEIIANDFNNMHGTVEKGKEIESLINNL
jgi:hypothetical protein